MGFPMRLKCFTTKAHKGYSQRTQSIVKQHIAFVFLRVYFVFFVVRKTFETTSLTWTNYCGLFFCVFKYCVPLRLN